LDISEKVRPDAQISTDTRLSLIEWLRMLVIAVSLPWHGELERERKDAAELGSLCKTLVATAPPDLVLASITVRYDTTAGVNQAASKLIGSGVDELREGGAAVPQGNAVGARCPWQSRPSVLDRCGIAVRANVGNEVSEGVLVTRVIDNSPGTYIYDRYAKRRKLIPGRDVITFLDDVPVDSVEAFESKIMAAGVRRVKLLVRDLSNGGFDEYIMWLR
jgi:hypothetical protein